MLKIAEGTKQRQAQQVELLMILKTAWKDSSKIRTASVLGLFPENIERLETVTAET